MSIPAEAWENSAACKDTDPDIFFPESGGGGVAMSAQAKAICRSCPVQRDCLDFALRHTGAYGETFGSYGIWGGTGERERRLLDKPRRFGRTA